jgi:hypothetical protein
MVLLPMMAIRGQGSHLREVLKVLAVHRNAPARFDLHSITSLVAGSPSKLFDRLVFKRW